MALTVSRCMAISLEQRSVELISRFGRRRAVGRVRVIGLACALFGSSLAAGNGASQTHSDPSAYSQAILAIQGKIQSGQLQDARTLAGDAAAKWPHDGGIENLLGVIEIEQGNTGAA